MRVGGLTETVVLNLQDATGARQAEGVAACAEVEGGVSGDERDEDDEDPASSGVDRVRHAQVEGVRAERTQGDLRQYHVHAREPDHRRSSHGDGQIDDE